MSCTKCGFELPTGAELCPKCGAPVAARCPRCGGMVPEGAQFCNNCGCSMQSGVSATRQESYATQSAEYAGFWRRFVALFIDGLVLIIPQLILRGIFGSEDSVGFILSYGLFLWLYFALMESSSAQATLGKMALGIVVVGKSGNRVSFGRATGRWLAKSVSFLLLLAGYIMAAFTEKKQALHDMMAGCLVIKRESLSRSSFRTPAA